MNLGYDILDPCRVKVCAKKGKEEGEEGRLRFHPHPEGWGLPAPPPSPPQVKFDDYSVRSGFIPRGGEGAGWLAAVHAIYRLCPGRISRYGGGTGPGDRSKSTQVNLEVVRRRYVNTG